MAGKRTASAASEKADKSYKKRKTLQSATGNNSGSEDVKFTPSRKIQKTAKSTGTANVRETQDTQSNACQATFNVIELLEEIIFWLPVQRILTSALRVSKTWNNAINASPTIQKKLWRRPRSPTVSSPVGLSYYNNIVNLHDHESYIYRALVSGVPMYSGTYHINAFFPDSPGQRCRHSLPDVPTLPVLTDSLLKGGRGAWPARAIWSQVTEAHMVQILMTRDHPSEASSETPTWLGMHLTEPPISTAWIEVFAETSGDRTRGGRLRGGRFRPPVLAPVQATVRDGGGVTFGLVREAADRMMARPTYEHFTRDQKPVTVRICFVVDGADYQLSEPPEDQRRELDD